MHRLRKILLLLGLMTLPLTAAAGVKTCVTGTDPVVANDISQIAALRAAINLRCICADYDGSSSDKTHRKYVQCARPWIAAAIGNGDLRRECKRTVARLYTHTTCGYPPPSQPANTKHTCISQRLVSGAVRCSIKPLSRCVSRPGVVSRMACTGIESCADATDDNGNFVFVNDPSGGDDGTCAHADPVVRFVAVGDTGKGNAGQLAVAAGINAKCASNGCDFVQLLGDNIYESGVTSTADAQWQTKFETPYANVVLPFFVVLGNHDYGGNGAGNEFGKELNEIDYSTVSAKWKLPAAYYHRKWRDVEFFATDTNAQMYAMDAQQKLDVAAWLGASSATWKIALGHHPYLSNGPHGNAGSYDGIAGNGNSVKSFMDNVVCGQADVHLAGHDHSMQWLTPTCTGTELIVSGSGASPTTLPGANAAYFQSLSLGFVYIVIDGKNFSAEFVDSSGATLFTRSFSKP